MTTLDDLALPSAEIDSANDEALESAVEEDILDEASQANVDRLVDACMRFMTVLVGHELFPYQAAFARRIIESVIIGDAEELTALFSRQCLDGDTVVFRRDGTAVRLRNHEDAWSTGIKPTKRYVVRGGGEIVATDNHPVMTPNGWVAAGLLREGDYVSTLEKWDAPIPTTQVSEEFARFLGYFITDGSFRPGQSPKFTNNRPEYLEEVATLADKLFGITAKRYGKGNGTDLLLTAPGQRNELTLKLRAMDWDHEFPVEVFTWPEQAVGQFVNRAWAGDGSVRVKRGRPDVFLACGNDEVYARYWQALLLRHGVRSTVKREWMAKGTGTFHRLTIANGSVPAFFALVGEVFGKEDGSRRALACCPPSSERPATWPCPGMSKHLYREGYRGESRDTCVRCDSPSPRATLGMGKGGASRRRPVTEGQDGELLGFSRVVRIEDAGEREVFDVTYDGKGWFIAQGVQVHNSGKSESVANTVATLMILLPRLARMFPDLLGKFANGLMVGMFAPSGSQAETIFGRTVNRLTSDRAVEILADPDIDDRVEGRTAELRLVKCGSLLQMSTASPRAKIESKSYHLIIIDEAQDADEYVVKKSISPMGSFYAATIVKIGTPATHKGDFYAAIQRNRRRQTKRGARINHFQADWKQCAKYNPDYAKSIRKEMLRMGEDSDEFQLAFALRWLLERGMFTTEATMEELGDKSMEVVRAWRASPVVVGIDPARRLDSTVVTVVWVDWDRPDEFGYFDHRILNWLEIQGDDWESQYGQIVSFLSAYDIASIAVDAQGVGDAVAQRLALLLPGVDVRLMSSNTPDQSKRWKHLTALMQRKMIGWPAHAKTRRLRTWRRFYQQMLDVEKHFQGQHVMISAPREADAHDDYVDSLALAVSCTADITLPEIEVTTSPFFSTRR